MPESRESYDKMTRKKKLHSDYYYYHLTEWEKDNDASPVCACNKYYILFYNFKIMISRFMYFHCICCSCWSMIPQTKKLLHPIIEFGGPLKVQIEY